VAAATKLLRDEFDRTYRFRDDITSATGPEDTSDGPSPKNVFDDLPAYRKIQYGQLDELACYMYSPPEEVRNEDVLNWWYEHKNVYPLLHRMALDYHTIPCKFI
jgi:hypothetical protein